jgi:nickel/cobalt transporter (NicO) family protein
MFSHSSRHHNILFMAAVAGGAACMLCTIIEVACAQGALGVGGAAGVAAAADGRVFGWVLAKQAAYYREFAGLIRAAKVDRTAFYGLLGLSFTYGIFHAAGPGHGKAVISSYLVANGESWRRGVVLSFASALLQALAAVAIVGIAAAMLGATAKTMGNAVRAIEVASYLVIFAAGLGLAWTKARGFAMEFRGWSSNRHNLDHPDEHHDRCFSGRTAIAVHHVETARASHTHHDHGADCGCGHSRSPEPSQLAGPGGWRRGVAAIFAVGLRPCSGAVLVLVFALAQGLFWVGVASTIAMGIGTAITVAALATLAVGASSLAVKLASKRGSAGALAIRGVELSAALLVAVFGLLLLTGYMANERLFGG